MQHQQLRGEIRQRIARRILAARQPELQDRRDRQIKRKRQQMQRIDAGHPPPEEALDVVRTADPLEVLLCDDKAGDDEEQVDEQVEVLDVGEDEVGDRIVLGIFHIVKNDHGCGSNDPERIQMRCSSLVAVERRLHRSANQLVLPSGAAIGRADAGRTSVCGRDAIISLT
jgi:hypothetical protein